jgi:hypothetical protein
MAHRRQVARVWNGASLALAAIVLIHFAINVVHGRAHDGAGVALPPSAMLFVYIVILAGPLLGLAVSRWRPIAGGSIVAATLGAAFVFGLINHFIIAGPDRVDHVAAAWRTVFGVTAALLLLTEAAGAAIGVWYVVRRVRSTS